MTFYERSKHDEAKIYVQEDNGSSSDCSYDCINVPLIGICLCRSHEKGCGWNYGGIQGGLLLYSKSLYRILYQASRRKFDYCAVSKDIERC